MTSQLEGQNQLLKQLLQTLEKEIQSKNQQQNIVTQELDNLYKQNQNLSNKVTNLLKDNRAALITQNQMRIYIQNLETTVNNLGIQKTTLHNRIQLIQKEKFMNKKQHVPQPMHIPSRLTQNKISNYVQTQKIDIIPVFSPKLAKQKSQEQKQNQKKLKNSLNELQAKIESLNMNLTRKQLELKSKNQLLKQYQETAQQRDETIQSLLNSITNDKNYEEELQAKQKMIIQKNNEIEENDANFLKIFGQLQQQWKQKVKSKQEELSQKEIQCRNTISLWQEKYSILMQQLEKVKAEINTQNIKISQVQMKDKYKNQSIQYLNSILMQLNLTKEQLQAQQKKNSQLQETNSSLQLSANVFYQQIQRLKQENQALSNQMTSSQSNFNQNQLMKYNLNSFTEQISALNEQIQKIEKQKAQIQAQNHDLIIKLKNKEADFYTKNEQFNQNLKLLTQKHEQAQIFLKKYVEQNKNYNQAIKRLQTQIQQLELDVAQTQTQRDNLKHQNKTKSEKIESLEKEIYSLQQRVEEIMLILIELRRQSVSTSNRIKEKQVQSILIGSDTIYEKQRQNCQNQELFLNSNSLNQFSIEQKKQGGKVHKKYNSNLSEEFQEDKPSHLNYENNLNIVIAPTESKSQIKDERQSQQYQMQIKIAHKVYKPTQQGERTLKIDETIKVDGEMTELDIQNLRNSFAAFGADIDFNRIAKNIGLTGAQKAQEKNQIQEKEQLIKTQKSISSLNKHELRIPQIDEEMMRSSIGSTNQYVQIVAYYEQKVQELEKKLVEYEEIQQKLRNDNNELLIVIEKLSTDLQNLKADQFEFINQNQLEKVQNQQKKLHKSGGSNNIQAPSTLQIQNLKLIQQLTQQIQQMHKEFSQYQKKNRILQQQKNQLEMQSQKLKQENLQTYQVNKDLFDQNVTLSQKIKEIEDQLAKNKKLFEEYYENHRYQLGNLQKVNRELNEKTEELALNHDRANRQIKQLNEKLAHKQQQLHHNLIQSSKLHVKIQNLHQQLSKVQNYVQILQKQSLKNSQLPISQGKSQSHHDISHQQFTINNISEINMEDSFNHDRERQLTMMNNVIKMLKIELEQERKTIQQKNMIIMDLEDNMSNSQNNSNNQKMMLRKNIADLNSQILSLKKELFKYSKDVNISDFIKNNFFVNKQKSLSQFQQKEQKVKSNSSFQHSPRGQFNQNYSFVTEKGKNNFNFNNSPTSKQMNMGEQFIGRKLKNKSLVGAPQTKFSTMAQLFSSRYNNSFTPTSQSTRHKKIPSYSQYPVGSTSIFRNSGDLKINLPSKQPTYGTQPRKRHSVTQE